MRISGGTAWAVLLAFLAGWSVQLLYQRWNPADPAPSFSGSAQETGLGGEGQAFSVSFAPLAETPAAGSRGTELVVVLARDLEKIRSLIGREARIRGRVFRVGHSAKSNTYFLDFGPSQEALTAVIFNSAAELFEKARQSPKQFENREVEIIGFIKEHPQYGLEVVLEHPKQIKLVN
jgi:hypothetical protein